MTEEKAREFFGELYYGEHHIPNKIKKFGNGFSVSVPAGIATYDSDHLTRLVFMAHRDCIRVEIANSSPYNIKITIHRV